MSRRVPRGGPGPEWPNEPDEGQAYGDQGAQPNGYGQRQRTTATTATDGNGHGAPGRDQQQQYGQTAAGTAAALAAPAGYGRRPSPGRAARVRPAGYGPPG